MPGATAACDRVGPGGVLGQGVTLPHLRQVRTDRVEIHGDLGRLVSQVDVARLDGHQQVPGEHGVAERHRDVADHTGGVRPDRMLGLHRLQHQQGTAGPHRVARADQHGHHRALHRREDGHLVARLDRLGAHWQPVAISAAPDSPGSSG
jgi:hypothetical protein